MRIDGYTTALWDAPKKKMRAILIARARDERTISYTELTGKVSTIRCSPDDSAFHHMLERGFVPDTPQYCRRRQAE